MIDPEEPRATVVILTFNGEAYLRRILSALERQEFDGGFETLVIDSGSTDSTLDIVAEFPRVRLHQIPNSEFGHGRTRNLAARMARGEFVAYLTHDAVPDHDRWLHELLRPFEINPRIVAVLGRQAPRPWCFPLMKFDVIATFAQFGPDVGVTVFGATDPPASPVDLDRITFYSDVNSAARRAFLVDVLPYRDVPYAEDQKFGQDLIAAGWWKAYAGRASVEHSNDVTYREFGKRIFDETVGLRRIGVGIGPLGIVTMLRLVVRGSVADSSRIVRDGQYTRKRKIYWLVLNPFFHWRKWAAYRSASRVDLGDDSAIRAGSLEHQRKG